MPFRTLVDAILSARRTAADADRTLPILTTLSREASGTEDNESGDRLLAWACVEALREMPTSETWHYLWSLTWHSSELERDLPRVTRTLALLEPEFKSQFLEIAAAVIQDAVDKPGRRANPRERELLLQLKDNWKQNPSLLSVWWGLREGQHWMVRDDDGVFAILADLAPANFIQLLSLFSDPFPIPWVLSFAGADWSFDRWKTLFSLAPPAFNEDRSWNGSAIAPLLLVIARDRISEAQNEIGPQASEEELKDVAGKIDQLTSEIAKALAVRPDAIPCAERWMTWLMRQTLGGVANEALPYPANARSRGYVDSVLISTIGRELGNSFWSSLAAPDAEQWEHWCYRCVLVNLATLDVACMPSAEDFLDQWKLSPEEWAEMRGQSLRDRAALFGVFGKRADAYGSRLLAIPLAEAHEPQRVWRHLWDTAETIRDIVEFGDPDARQDHALDTGLAACELMQLVFALGLMMLECVVDPNRKIQCGRQVSLEVLFQLLADAVGEMSAIDRFSRTFWNDAVRHLAVRRAIWVGGSGQLAATFPDDAKPTFGDFIAELSGDTEGLLALIDVALRNRVSIDMLRKALDDAGIDLVAHISLADRLIAISPKRSGVGPEQLSAARSLLASSAPAT
ncbi:MAG TPA: hypothetical protein VIJ38_04430 [Acidobacteriaceae bacterium]